MTGRTKAASVGTGRGPGYLRMLLWLLASATFFQGYDTQLISVLLPDLQSSFHVGEATLGVVRVPIDLGLFVAFFVGRLADRVGRRRILLWSVTIYTVFTALTALSWDLWSFAVFQFAARVFLGAESAIGITMIVEEFPASRRGRALGTLLGFAAFGAIVVGVLVGAGLREGPLGWRLFYLIGLGPLVALIYYRRNIRETERFRQMMSAGGDGAAAAGTNGSFFAAWARPHRRYLVRVGLVFLLIAVPQYGAFGWLAFFAERERGFTSADVALFIVGAYGLGCTGFFACGWALRRFGRRRTALVYAAGAAVFMTSVFLTTSKPVMFVAMLLAVFFTLGIHPVLSTFATELFPTEIRASATVWIRNVFEIAGTVSGPALVGILGDHTTGAIGRVGNAAALLCVLYLPAMWIIARLLPETGGRLTETRPTDTATNNAANSTEARTR